VKHVEGQGSQGKLVETTVPYAVIPGNDPESSPACHGEAVKALTQRAAEESCNLGFSVVAIKAMVFTTEKGGVNRRQT